MVRNIVGAPARGTDFFGRDQFVSLVWHELQKESILLAAPRRFGKTSVMYRLIDEPQNNFQIVHADLEHLSDPTDLMLELVVKLTKHSKLGRMLDGISFVSKEIWNGLRDTVDEVELFDVKVKLREQMRPHWEEIGRQVFRRVSQAEYPLLFILDEFPMMIDRMARLQNKREEARALLHWLRALRQSPELGNVRFLIAGSIGIESVLNGLGEIKTINDFRTLKLEPFSSTIASDFLQALAETDQMPLPEECRQKMLEMIGIFVPYFLQILYSKVHETYWLTGTAITAEEIGHIYHEKVLGVDCKTYFDHYYGRLRDYYLPQEEKAVKRLLREMARKGTLPRNISYEIFRETTGDGFGQDEFNITLTNLENDFYIRYNAETRQYEFACKLLRDWWLRHYALETI
jgi:hypothetical protein